MGKKTEKRKSSTFWTVKGAEKSTPPCNRKPHGWLSNLDILMDITWAMISEIIWRLFPSWTQTKGRRRTESPSPSIAKVRAVGTTPTWQLRLVAADWKCLHSCPVVCTVQYKHCLSSNQIHFPIEIRRRPPRRGLLCNCTHLLHHNYLLLQTLLVV